MTIQFKNQFRTDKNRRKSVAFVRSGHTDTIENEENITELVTQINIPLDGGWGWVVVVTSFSSLFILDGSLLTFGILLPNIRDDLKSDGSLIALINSVTYFVYFSAGPLSSAVINKYGFRECAMIGSFICSIALLASSYSRSYGSLLLCYGFITGLGAGFISMAACLVVGFYFERLRAIVLSITSCGSSIGCLVLSILYNYFVEKAGWRPTILFQSGLFGCLFFLAMFFKPLTPMYVSTGEEAAKVEKAGVSQYMPSVACIEVGEKEGTERLFNVVTRFPTVADLVQNPSTPQVQVATQAPTTSDARSASKFTLSPISPENIDERQLKKAQSVHSAAERKRSIDVTVKIEPPKKEGFCKRHCKWRRHITESRPMYRDDVFYNGEITDLPIYRKSVVPTEEERFAIEYHLAVTRAARAEDITEHRTVCPRAMRRVLATMIDPALLQKGSFLLLCTSAFFFYLGILVPYVYLKARNTDVGIDSSHSTNLISFIGFTSTVGKLVVGVLSKKVSVLKLYLIAIFMSAAATAGLNLCFNLYYQYVCVGVFGFFANSLATLRTIILVELYGLENLTNATGIVLLFNGVASLISTPLAGIVQSLFGYAASFYTTAFYFFLCGVIMFPAYAIARKEEIKRAQNVEFVPTPLPRAPSRSSIKKRTP